MISHSAITSSVNAIRPSNTWERPKQVRRIPSKNRNSCRLLTFFTTGENGVSVNDSDKDRVTRVNRLADSIGLEASLEDEAGEETSFSEADAPSADAPSSQPVSPVPVALNANRPAIPHSNTNAGHRSSLCNALGELKGTLAESPSTTFNLANCAETNGRPAEAVRLLEKYLEMSPKALDAD